MTKRELISFMDELGSLLLTGLMAGSLMLVLVFLAGCTPNGHTFDFSEWIHAKGTIIKHLGLAVGFGLVNVAIAVYVGLEDIV